MLVKASAGMKLTRLGNQLAANGIAGFEFATGIPGCIGGAVRMNHRCLWRGVQGYSCQCKGY